MTKSGITFCLGLMCLLVVGCSQIRGRSTAARATPQSPYYLTDGPTDLPPGPEFKLSNQVQALKEYKLEQDRLRSGIEDEVD